MRRKLLGGLVATSSLLTLFPSGAAASGHVVVIETRGWGHGVGMAQDGALAMGQDGASAGDILGHFYPGTSIARRGGATVRVGVLDAPGAVVVAFPSGGEVRDSPSGPQPAGFPVTVSPGGSVELSFDRSRYRAKPLSGATLGPVAPGTPQASAGGGAAPAPGSPPGTPETTKPPDPVGGLLGGLLAPTTTTTAPPAKAPTAAGAPPGAPGGPPTAATGATSGRSLWAIPRGSSTVALPGEGRRYRGTMEATAGGGGLRLVNQVDVEQYLRGMGEVLDPGWPAASLQAQAIAARTYALWTTASGRELCSTQQCQVYLGEQAEYGAMNAAVQATRGQVLTYEGALVEALYSANAGGVSATPEEGFGPGSNNQPYLRPATYRSADPRVAETRMPLAELARRFGYGGDVADVRVGRAGPSGRAIEVVFEGSAGPMVVPGQRFWNDLSLPSSLYTVRVEAPAPEAEPVSLVGGEQPGDAGVRAEAAAPARQAVVESSPFGRSPWVAVAVLLMSTWGLAARRATAAR